MGRKERRAVTQKKREELRNEFIQKYKKFARLNLDIKEANEKIADYANNKIDKCPQDQQFILSVFGEAITTIGQALKESQ